MFRLPNPPTQQARIHEIADFVEWQAWCDGQQSLRTANSTIDRLSDNFENEGCDDDSDEVEQSLDEVAHETERRANACNGNYPFQLNPQGTVLQYIADEQDEATWIYLYLLLATRLNMRDHRRHVEIDGALLMEELCEVVIKNYLGGDRTRSLLFWTSTERSFEPLLNDLCKTFGEGGYYNPKDQGPHYTKDGKLDVVNWIPFADDRSNKLCIFTQCKTGTSWDKHLTELLPEAFLRTWTASGGFDLLPLRAFCVAEALDNTHWTEYNTKAGLFFDRCRLVDFASPIAPELLTKICKWTEAAREFVENDPHA